MVFRVRDVYFYDSLRALPDGRPDWNSPTTGALALNVDSGTVFRAETKQSWEETNRDFFKNYLKGGGLQGEDGASAYEVALINGFVGTEQEWLDSLKGAQGEPGPQGPPGTSSGGYTSSLSPDSFGAIHESKTFGDMGYTQSMVDDAYPGMGVKTTDYIDWAALQRTINEAKKQNKSITLHGNYFINKPLVVTKSHYRMSIKGNFAKIFAISPDFNVFIARERPMDDGDAQTFVPAKYEIKNIEFIGFPNQTALQLGPSYGSSYTEVIGDNLNTLIDLEFALMTKVSMCEAVNCMNPFISRQGDWDGVSMGKSQSNVVTFHMCRAYMPPQGEKAFQILGVSGNSIIDCIIEGHKVTTGIDFNGLGSTVVKDFTVQRLHFECPNGADDAVIKVNILGGNVTIDHVFGQHAAKLLDATSGSGLGHVTIKNVPWWVPINGKAFSSSNISFHFEHCDAFRSGTKALATEFWEGTAPQEWGGLNSGTHKYTVTPVPR